MHVPVSLEVDRSSRWMRVWRMGQVLRKFRIAVGALATPTPRGRFAITDKFWNFMPSIQRYLMELLPLGTQVVVHD